MKAITDKESKKTPSLFTYALRIAIPVGVVILFALWFIQNHILHSIVEAESREHIEEVATRETDQIQNNLNGLRIFARSLAANELIINSLFDLQGREDYIPIFFHSLIAPLSADANVSLLDYTGRGIVSSARNKSMPPVSPEMIEEGAFIIDSHRLLIVEPILVSGAAEGAIVLDYPSTTFDILFGETTTSHGLFVIGYGGLVVYSTNTELARLNELILEEAKPGWLQVQSAIPQSNLKVVVGSSLEVTSESLETIRLVQIIGLITLLLVTIGLLLFSIFIVSRPLKRFTTSISAIKSIEDLNKQLDTKGPREIAKIATTFNRMTGWLKSTTVSRNYMDNILASITEGIITIDQKGVISTFNDGAATMFGYHDSEVIGKNISMLLPAGERSDHDVYLAKSSLHAPRIIGQNRDLEGCRKDGSLFPLELVVVPLTEDGTQGFVGTIRDITERKLIEERLEQRSQELKRINKELEHMALNDAMTDLGNRNLFNQRLSNLIANCKRNQDKFSLLMMDLNEFKQVNDTYGHEAGDEVLREVGRRLKMLGRDADSFFRLGGDEFAALITTGVTPEGIVVMARRIISALTPPVEYNSAQLEIGISVGIVLFPTHSEDGDELLRLADIAMYEAKRGQLGYKISCVAEKA